MGQDRPVPSSPPNPFSSKDLGDNFAPPGAQHAYDASTVNGSHALPPVSVIMAVYNGERYVAEAVESILRQTHGNLEFIIVNDGSTDGTRSILAGYATRDRRVKVIDQENADQPASLNRALAAARNEWVVVLDADDVCMPHRLETQLRALQRLPLVRVLGSYAFWMDHTGGYRGVRALGPTSIPEFTALVEGDKRIALVHPSVIMHRPTILALGGYDPKFGAAADVELWSRVADEHAVLSLPEPLVYYRVQPGSMSVTRFFEQRLMLSWSQARQTARRQGLTPPDLEEYLESRGGRFTLRQLKHRREDWAEYLKVRKRLESWRGRRLRALLLRAVRTALTPRLFLRKRSAKSARRDHPSASPERF